MQIVITGANRGIGHALFCHYRNLGHDVLGTARRDTAYHLLDVTQPDSFAALVDRLDGTAVDLLICNAGVYLDKGQSLADGFGPEIWAESFAANVTGVFLTVQNLLPNLQLSQQGKIAIISSQMGSDTRAPGGSYAYRASKAAALNLGRNLASDLRGLGISVGIYHPGWVKTDMGGAAAEITVEQSTTGLADRFEALDLECTGCFQTWDGRDHPY